jgi:hypothetical protein
MEPDLESGHDPTLYHSATSSVHSTLYHSTTSSVHSTLYHSSTSSVHSTLDHSSASSVHSTLNHSSASSVHESQCYGKLLAQEYLDPDAPYPSSIDRVLTFRRLRRYDLVRIEHDLLRLYCHLKSDVSGGTEDDRNKLTPLLHCHGVIPFIKQVFFKLISS